MAETKKPVQTVLITYVCDKCGAGEMLPTGIMQLTDPPKWPHRCGACGHEQTFYCKYPKLGYEAV